MATVQLSGTTLATLDAILKDYYLPPVVEQLNNQVVLLSRLDSSDDNIFGRRAIIPVHTGRTGGIGGRFEGDPIPQAGVQSYADAIYDLLGQFGRIRVTGLSMQKTSNVAGAFLQSLKQDMDGIRRDLKKDLARQIYGSGNGQIAVCGVTTASTTVVLGANGAEAINKGQLYPNMLVDIGTAGNMQSVIAGNKIVSVNAAGPSIVISSAVTTSGSNFVYRAGATGQATAAEVNGLRNIVADATTPLGGIDPSVAGNGYWDNLRKAVGGNLSMDLLAQGWNLVRQQGTEPSLAITSLGVQRGYFDLFTQTTKFTEPMQLDGGWTALNFNGKPLVADIDAPYGHLYFLDESNLKVFSPSDFGFLDEDGQTLHRNLDYDSYEAALGRYMQVGATRRNTQFVFTGVQVNGATDPGY